MNDAVPSASSVTAGWATPSSVKTTVPLGVPVAWLVTESWKVPSSPVVGSCGLTNSADEYQGPSNWATPSVVSRFGEPDRSSRADHSLRSARRGVKLHFARICVDVSDLVGIAQSEIEEIA